MKLQILIMTLLLPTLSIASTDAGLVAGSYKCKKVISETASGQKLEEDSSEELSIERFHGKNINFDMESFNVAMSPDDCKVLYQEDADIKAKCDPSLSQVSFTRTVGTDETKATSILLFMQSGSKVIVADTTHVAKSIRKDADKTTKMVCSLE